ncbi:MAG: hypothetical protein ABUS79_00325 [Pseudomonadota bacterium]
MGPKGTGAVAQPPSRSTSQSPAQSPSQSWVAFFQRLLPGAAREWVLLFLIVQSAIDIDGFVNPNARWASLCAIVEDGTMRIDNYHQHTMDWARTPDGHTHSNKAPGPVMVALPLFWAIDRAVVAGAADRAERDARRIAARVPVLHALSVVTQAIPWALLVAMVIGLLRELAVPRVAQHLAAVALLFGNTASLLMNTFFGHGMAACFVLAAALSLYRRWSFRLGLFFGLAVLSDYGVALLALPLIVLLVRGRWTSMRDLRGVALGLAAPAVAFVAYHAYSFGGPLALPNKFQNPVFVDTTAQSPTLWGVLRWLPDPEVFLLLLFGSERGVAFTQGWVLLSIAALAISWRGNAPTLTDPDQRAFVSQMGTLVVSGFALLLTMNACFLGWHGGEAPGPRYLSAVLPLFALPAACLFSTLPPFARHLFVAALGVSVALFVLVFGTANILPQGGPLFSYYLRVLRDDLTARAAPRTLVLSLGFAGATFRAWKDCQDCRPRPHQV